MLDVQCGDLNLDPQNPLKAGYGSVSILCHPGHATAVWEAKTRESLEAHRLTSLGNIEANKRP